MPESSWNTYHFFNAGQVFTPEVLIQCKKPGGLDRKFWYGSTKFYSDIIFPFDFQQILT